MNIIINNDLETFWSEKTDQERCGLLFGHISESEIVSDVCVEVPNAHKEPEDFFGITEAQIKRASSLAETRDLQLIGPIHTHVRGFQGELSYEDITGLRKSGLRIGVMLHVPTKTIVYYDEHGFMDKEKAA